MVTCSLLLEIKQSSDDAAQNDSGGLVASCDGGVRVILLRSDNK